MKLSQKKTILTSHGATNSSISSTKFRYNDLDTISYKKTKKKEPSKIDIPMKQVVQY